MKTRVIEIFDSTIANYSVQKEVYRAFAQHEWQTVENFKSLESAKSFACRLSKQSSSPKVIAIFGEDNETNHA